MNRLNRKVMIVTGGGSGIGRSACVLSALEGALVAVTDMSDQEGKAVAEEIRAQGAGADFWHLDVTSESDVAGVFQRVHERFGRIDCIVSNAGIAGPNKPTHEITEQEWDAVMAVNLKGVFFCTKHAIPYMRANGGGSIINLSSIYGIVGAADLPAYHAAKGGIRSMTKNDAVLYAVDNIRVNSVHPGFIWTAMVERLGAATPGGVPAFRAMLEKKHPIGHVGEPDDVGWAVVYLASDESKFVTGSELVVDGGYTAQ